MEHLPVNVSPINITKQFAKQSNDGKKLKLKNQKKSLDQNIQN